MKASIVLGLQFGDEGKGVTTDYLCSQDPLNSIVVRFSGGQQAGHAVIHNGVKHVHSNFGSGTLRGVPSYFSEHCCIYPPAIREERKVLNEKGILPELMVHPLAKLTTPFDLAYNRVCDITLNHGSCGMGVGATMQRHNNTGHKVFAIDLTSPKILTQKLKMISRLYVDIIKDDQRPLYMDILLGEIDKFGEAIKSLPPLFAYTGYEALRNYKHIIFEGSQGILLDMNHGIFPNVTYAETTSKNASEICRKIGVVPEVYYVTRCYQTRHGNGYMSSEDPVTLINNEEETNISNQWQGDFRTGELDYDLLNYALAVDDSNTFLKEKNLVITCLDQRPDFRFDADKIDLDLKSILSSASPESGNIRLYEEKEKLPG